MPTTELCPTSVMPSGGRAAQDDDAGPDVRRKALSLVVTYRAGSGRLFNTLLYPIPEIWKRVRVGERVSVGREPSPSVVAALWVEHAEPRLATAVSVPSVAEWEETGATVSVN